MLLWASLLKNRHEEKKAHRPGIFSGRRGIRRTSQAARQKGLENAPQDDSERTVCPDRMCKVQHVGLSVPVLRKSLLILPLVWKSHDVSRVSVRPSRIYLRRVPQRRHVVYQRVLLYVQHISGQGLLDNHCGNLRRRHHRIVGDL